MSKEEVEVSVAPNQDSINVIKEWITVTSLLLYDIHYDRRVTCVSITNFIRPYLHQFFIDSHGLNGYGKPLKRPFDRY